MLAEHGEPLFCANWDHAVFIHYESDPSALQNCVPYAIDLYDGRAFVSVVAFTLRGMRLRLGGKISEWLFKPIATHRFFNVRTYVQHRGESAIYFMAEWLSSRLSVILGPATFGLPYRFGKVEYEKGANGTIQGTVSAKEGAFAYRARIPTGLSICQPGSLGEFLLERYTAFTSAGRRKKFFRVWHEPWKQTSIELKVRTDNLLASTGDWWPTAKLISANYSPGVGVWMGRPHFVEA
jgi:uncharacterized protein